MEKKSGKLGKINMKIESKTVTLKESQENIFNFLSDFRNFENLIPQDKVSKWTASQDTCSFNINGMADIGMKITKLEQPSTIHIDSHGKNPFAFTLTANIKEIGENSSEVNLMFNADVNPFLSMMAEKPLTNFFNMIADKLQVIYG
ncbi:MAG: SRPBCC family protein [Bacteroidetes bacterium]|nr:SRPBCC family protein [Bacteroidota bacterium]